MDEVPGYTFIRTKAIAVKKPYIQVNPPLMTIYFVFDDVIALRVGYASYRANQCDGKQGFSQKTGYFAHKIPFDKKAKNAK